MSLFKPLWGKRSNLDSTEQTEGTVYFCKDDGTVHVDYIDDNGDIQRLQINAKDAETISGTPLSDLTTYMTQVTVSTLGWDSSTLTKSVIVNGISADETAQIINVVPVASSMSSAVSCGVYCTEQGENSLTFSCATIPTVDLTFNISWKNVNYI